MVGSPDFAVIHPCEERSRRFATIVRSRPAPRNRPFVCGRRSTLHEPPRSSMDSTVSILVYHASFLHVQRFRVDAFDVSFLLRKLRALRNPWMNDEQNQGKNSIFSRKTGCISQSIDVRFKTPRPVVNRIHFECTKSMHEFVLLDPKSKGDGQGRCSLWTSVAMWTSLWCRSR